MTVTIEGTTRPNVTSLRWLLTFFFAGVGCLIPYLSLHARAVGLSLEDARTISWAAPLLALLGPLIAALLMDRFYCTQKPRLPDTRLESNTCIRLSLALTILLSAVFYCLLLTVPETQRTQSVHQSEISFACDDRGAAIVQPGCGGQCLSNAHSIPLRLTDCAFDHTGPPLVHPAAQTGRNIHAETESTAPDTTTTPSDAEVTMPELPARPAPPRGVLDVADVGDVDAFFGTPDVPSDDEDDDDGLEGGSGDIDSSDWHRRERRRREVAAAQEPLPPHICYGDPAKRMCNVYTPYSASLRVNATLQPGILHDTVCYYPLGNNYACPIPLNLEQPQISRVTCQLEDPDVVAGSVQCQETGSNYSNSFLLYLLFRSLGDMFLAITFSLLIGASLTTIGTRLGRELVLPSAAYAACAVSVGFLHTAVYTPAFFLSVLTEQPKYIFAFSAHALLFFLSAAILVCSRKMPLGPPDWWITTASVRFRHKAELFGLLLVLTLLGMLWGPQVHHLPLQLESADTVMIYIGCSLALSAVVALPIVYKADLIIDFCGYSNLLIAAFTFYILRYTGLLLLRSRWVVLLTGVLEVFTLPLVFLTALLYIRQLVPKHLTFTAHALGFIAHFCLGNGLGCLVATLLSPPAATLATITPASNSSAISTDDLEPAGDFDDPYAVLYCSAAVFAAVAASIYFLLYHICLKKRCLAPHYRKPPEHEPAVVLQGGARNGTYTPLLVFTNGRPKSSAPD